MPRKTKEETALTRSRILDVALEVFADQGYSRTSLHQIAERAGFTRGAVYWHFKNKADLFMALAEEVAAGADEVFADVSAVDSRDQLKRALTAYLERLETDERLGTFYRVLEYRTEWVEELTPLLEQYRGDSRALAEWIVAVLRRLRRRRQVAASCDPERDGFTLQLQFIGLLTLWLTDPTSISLARDAPKQIDHILEGLAP